MHRLTNHSRSTGSHLHPIPSQHSCATLCTSSPSKPPATTVPLTTTWATQRRDQSLTYSSLGKQKWCFPPKKPQSAISPWLQGCPLHHQPCLAMDMEPWMAMGSIQGVPAAPRPTSPIKLLHITSLMLMDFSLMPQIKVIGLGWVMNPAELGRRREHPHQD